MSTRPSAIILDVDGVLLDSNTLKEQNIRKAASTYADEALVNEFVAYDRLVSLKQFLSYRY